MRRDEDFREFVKVLRRALLMIVAWCDAYLHRTDPGLPDAPADARLKEAAPQR